MKKPTGIPIYVTNTVDIDVQFVLAWREDEILAVYNWLKRHQFDTLPFAGDNRFLQRISSSYLNKKNRELVEIIV